MLTRGTLSLNEKDRVGWLCPILFICHCTDVTSSFDVRCHLLLVIVVCAELKKSSIHMKSGLDLTMTF